MEGRRRAATTLGGAQGKGEGVGVGEGLGLETCWGGVLCVAFGPRCALCVCSAALTRLGVLKQCKY